MKKVLILILSLTLVNIVAVCQKQISISKSCSYYGEKIPAKIFTFSSDADADAAIRLITDAAGLAPNFIILAGDVPNACAVSINNNRYIIYNQTFLYNITKRINYWGSLSILAHEIGHHLNGHTLLPGGSRPSIELEADKYSGFILAKLGASLDDAQSAINSFASDYGSDTHPPKSARLAAIANGWYQNSSESSSNQNSTSRKSPAKRPSSLFYGNEFKEQVFIKKSSVNSFELISEKGYLFSKSEYSLIDLNNDYKIFWFPFHSSYGYVENYSSIQLNELFQCEAGSAPLEFPTEGITLPGNYLIIYYPNEKFNILSNGKFVVNRLYQYTDSDYFGAQSYIYSFNNGYSDLNIKVDLDKIKDARIKNKIIISRGRIIQ